MHEVGGITSWVLPDPAVALGCEMSLQSGLVQLSSQVFFSYESIKLEYFNYCICLMLRSWMLALYFECFWASRLNDTLKRD